MRRFFWRKESELSRRAPVVFVKTPILAEMTKPGEIFFDFTGGSWYTSSAQ
jgi:hypothetical protein